MILLIDNYDSFTYNLAQLLGEYSEVVILRNDAPQLQEEADRAEALVFSPGPGIPSEAGQMEGLIRKMIGQKPMLGICLGHQAIGEVLGGEIKQAQHIRHGKVSEIDQLKKGDPLFRDLPEQLEVMRYHSLVLTEDLLPESLEVTARALDDGEIMAIRHRTEKIYGVQFHPESIGSPFGQKILQNFIEIVKEEQQHGKFSAKSL
ncbi:anthranilate synthase component II [Listeria costaricensis]|uniref:anthranilate synthase component II n=1 Tax=Listeria costaricensis TaxID=2026604 RepID=UPI000C080764|nr:aminodeoxychorismate/anthranilate synthase component II [Listeria costaricensis]